MPSLSLPVQGATACKWWRLVGPIPSRRCAATGGMNNWLASPRLLADCSILCRCACCHVLLPSQAARLCPAAGMLPQTPRLLPVAAAGSARPVPSLLTSSPAQCPWRGRRRRRASSTQSPGCSSCSPCPPSAPPCGAAAACGQRPYHASYLHPENMRGAGVSWAPPQTGIPATDRCRPTQRAAPLQMDRENICREPGACPASWRAPPPMPLSPPPPWARRSPMVASCSAPLGLHARERGPGRPGACPWPACCPGQHAARHSL